MPRLNTLPQGDCERQPAQWRSAAPGSAASPRSAIAPSSCPQLAIEGPRTQGTAGITRPLDRRVKQGSPSEVTKRVVYPYISGSRTLRQELQGLAVVFARPRHNALHEVVSKNRAIRAVLANTQLRTTTIVPGNLQYPTRNSFYA